VWGVGVFYLFIIIIDFLVWLFISVSERVDGETVKFIKWLFFLKKNYL
jgi:hypothetical protein